MYCKQAIALAINIKNHFDRVMNQQVDRTVVVQVFLPFQMPTHLENMRKVCEECRMCSVSQNARAGSSQVREFEDNFCFAECSRCIRHMSFDEFARSLVTAASHKIVSKKHSVSGRTGFRKRPMTDEDEYLLAGSTKRHREQQACEDYSPMDCMHRAVGLQRAQRVLRSSKEAALEELSSSFDFDEAGSALLLELKENKKIKHGQEGNDRGEERGEESDGGVGELAGDCQGLHSVTQTPLIVSADPLACDKLHITTSPFAYEKRSSPEYLVGMDTPTGPMHDLLYSCYRDGIYPSPVLHHCPCPSTSASLGDMFQSNNQDIDNACASTEVDAGEACVRVPASLLSAPAVATPPHVLC
eukprot:Colp12_sorted_trinity150504_noHs@1839